jgi:hypothetical protein
MSPGVSQAAELAKLEVQRQHALGEAYRASAIFVVNNQPGLSTHMAMRDVAKLDFIHEILVWHEPATKEVFSVWEDCPKELHGKPVLYLPQHNSQHEMAKYTACARETNEDTTVCYFQQPHRDATGYLHSLWASFLRSPETLHSAVSARTFFLDQV